MIREYSSIDEQKLIKYLEKENLFLPGTENILHSEDNKLFLLYNEEDIIGVAVILGFNVKLSIYDISIYVSKENRNQGLGTKLYNYTTKYLKSKKPNVISVKFVDKDKHTLEFFKKRGYEELISYHEMSITTQRKKKISDEFEFFNYDDIYYEEFLKLMYYKLLNSIANKKINPCLRTEVEDDMRETLLQNKDNVYLLSKDNKILSCLTIRENCIEDLMVDKSLRELELEKNIIKFGINEIKDRGYDLIKIHDTSLNPNVLSAGKEVGFTEDRVLYVHKKRDNKI